MKMDLICVPALAFSIDVDVGDVAGIDSQAQDSDLSESRPSKILGLEHDVRGSAHVTL